MNTESLVDLLVNNVPKSFLESYFSVLPSIYREAASASETDSLLNPAQAKWVKSYYRRAICESRFKNMALTAGLVAIDAQHHAHNCDYTLVQAGRIGMIQQGAREGEPIRPAKSRAQHRAVNRFLDSPAFNFVHPPSVYDPGNFFCILAHGATKDAPDTPAYVDIIFPPAAGESVDASMFRYKMTDLLEAYPSVVRHDVIEPIRRIEPIRKGSV